ncbi:hypothetical protein ACFE04_020468 [Oxalis oulophora]
MNNFIPNPYKYSPYFSTPEVALNKGLVCNLNPLCNCGYYSVLMTSYTDENMGKRFFSCGSSEATINNDAVQWLSRELAVARDDATWCRKERDFFNVVSVEIVKLSKGVQEMINVINEKKGIKPGRAVRKFR